MEKRRVDIVPPTLFLRGKINVLWCKGELYKVKPP